MADPLTIAASALAIISTAIQSTKSLYDAVSSYGSRDKPLGRLQDELHDELQDLAKTLDALKEVVDAEPSKLELLRGSIDRCSKVCHDFEQSMEILNPSAPRNIEDFSGADSLATSTAMTAERAYYHCGIFFIKRGLRPSEYKTTIRGTKHVPRLGKERLQNEAAALRFIRRISNIPVPTLYGTFEVDDSFVLITEHVDGVSMSDLSDNQVSVVRTELEQHLATLRGIKSNTIGGPSGIVLPPYRVMRLSDKNEWPRSTQASDLFLYMSAFTFPKEVHWVEFRLVPFDQKSGESIGEHLFFLPRVETTTWNLRRVRRQLLDTISWHELGATSTSFRLSLWPRMEPLQSSSQLALSPLVTLSTTLFFNPEFFVHNILGNYK